MSLCVSSDFSNGLDGMCNIVFSCEHTRAQPDRTVTGPRIKRLVQKRSTMEARPGLNVKGLIQNHRHVLTVHVANIERHNATVGRF